jgi:membrane-associated phospholipid phosphatase
MSIVQNIDIKPTPWRPALKLHDALKRFIEKTFFGGRSTSTSEYVVYVFANVVLMLLVFFVLLNTIGYDWTGSLYPPGSGYRLDFLTGGLEDAIPLVPQFVVFYVYLFYPLAIVTMLFFGFVEYRKGYALGWSLVAINAIALAVYLVFPVSTYWWRQEFLANPIVGDFWAGQVYGIWAGDTSFNCFPSLHAAVSTICFYAWYRYSRVRRNSATKVTAFVALFIAMGVILSTLFIKQHYVADEIAGILLAWVVGKFFFDRLWPTQRNS